MTDRQLVFIGLELETEIPDASNNPNCIQLGGACDGTNLVVLSVQLRDGTIAGSINPNSSGATVFVPADVFVQLRDCLHQLPVQVVIDCHVEARLKPFRVCSSSVPPDRVQQVMLDAQLALLRRDGQQVTQIAKRLTAQLLPTHKSGNTTLASALTTA